MQKSGRRRQKSGGFGASLPWADSERCDNPPFGGRVSLQRGHIRCILLVDHNHYVFQLWSESQPRHRFLTILRRAANESDSTGRLPAAAGLGAGAAVWGPVGSECCRSFGLPAGLAHRDLLFLQGPLQIRPVRPLSRCAVDLAELLLLAVDDDVGYVCPSVFLSAPGFSASQDTGFFVRVGGSGYDPAESFFDV